MFNILIRRLGLGLVTVVIVSIIVFSGVEMLPGDACTAFLEQQAEGKRLENCRERLGLIVFDDVSGQFIERPAIDRYIDWAAGAMRGDLGNSASGRYTIAELVGNRMLNSLLLAGCALALGVPLAIFFGVVAALFRDRISDIMISSFAIFGMTIPEFVTATLLILMFSFWLEWLPGIVLLSPNDPLSDFLPLIILPVITLSFVMVAHILRTVRSSVIEVMGSDYIQMAILRGVPYWQCVFGHALPNALLPTINVVALTTAWLLGGVVVTEYVFNYPGLGRMMITSISDRDLPVVQAIALIVASTYVLVNLTADLLTMIANPRLRTLEVRK